MATPSTPQSPFNTLLNLVHGPTSPKAKSSLPSGFDIDTILAQINANYFAKPSFYKVTILDGAPITRATQTSIPGSGSQVNKSAGFNPAQGNGIIWNSTNATNSTTKSSGSFVAGSKNILGVGSQNQGKSSFPASTQVAPITYNTTDVTMNCCALSLTGININFFHDKRYGIGITNKFASGKEFLELTMTFYESARENERDYFVKWLDQIYDPVTRRMGFYNEYTKNIIVDLYSRQGEKVYTAKFKECFPTSVGQLDRSYSGDNSIPQFTVALQLFEIEENQD